MDSTRIIRSYFTWHYTHGLEECGAFWYRQLWIHTYACGIPDIFFAFWHTPRFVRHDVSPVLREVVRVISIIARLVVAAVWAAITTSTFLVGIVISTIWIILPVLLAVTLGVGIFLIIASI